MDSPTLPQGSKFALHARLDGVGMRDGLMHGADRDLVKIWQKMNAKRYDSIMLKSRTVAPEATPEGISARVHRPI